MSDDGLTHEQHRHLTAVPAPGLVPVTVTRQVPMTVITGADGTQVVETDTAEPCYACPCCVLWAGTVDKLRESMVEHENGDHANQEATAVTRTVFGEVRTPLTPAQTFPGCLVCQLLAGVVDNA